MHTVIVEKEFEVKEDASAKRVFPAGWKGVMTEEQKNQLLKEEKGRVLGGEVRPKPAAKQTTAKVEPAAKQTTAKAEPAAKQTTAKVAADQASKDNQEG